MTGLVNRPWDDLFFLGRRDGIESALCCKATGALLIAQQICSGSMNGDPRSLTKTKGDVGLSRCSRPKARSSSPWVGGVCAGRAVLDSPDVEHPRRRKKRPHFGHVMVRTLPAWGLRYLGFGWGDRAMWIVLSYATMVLLGGLGLLAACEDI
jgi:hypothetical protein